MSVAVKTTKSVEVQCSIRITPAMIFADLTSDLDVNYFTGLRNIDAFRLVFDYLSEKGKSNSNALLERTFEHFNRPHIPSESQQLKS